MTDKVTIIEARRMTLSANLSALWQYRTFYRFLFMEITLKKFRDTMLGFWWLVIRPLVPTTLAIVIFTFIVPMETGGIPYPLFYLSGFITWNLFQSLVIFMPRTLLWMQGMMRRTYFPKLLVPAASLGPPLVELVVTTSLFMMAVGCYALTYGHMPLSIEWRLLLFPFCLAMTLLFGMAIGIVTSVVAVFFRDIVFSVSYFTQMLMFLTPVIYPVTFVPEAWRPVIYLLNPMAKLVETSRWALTGSGHFDPTYLAIACTTIIVFFILSIAFFLRAEPFLSDEA